ncbi:hypothetical protein BHU72_01885 [Desulfuribacillus stibiiarsenatis]|uniref:Uncharacterized protein n=1 Tax=Desulfuribacillus stibiiarsenatis TaxID=1390249 RepID=A0A1E5L6H6_9FIRM|nr:ABC-three component system middle component 1 [Desulfuribacillus stibiiarsenatis]OEH85573.1 hypothetical protein BHU72_01885 [Desulfuribacillus stibiiarsenatis]
MNFDKYNEGTSSLSCEDNCGWFHKVSCWVGKEYGYNIYVFQVIVENENDLEKYYEAIAATIATDFQSRLEKSIEKWNVYLVFCCKEKISMKLKGEIEQDKYSTRKLVWDSMGESEIREKRYLKNRLFNLNIYVDDNNTSDNISLLEKIRSINLDLYQAIKNPEKETSQQLAIYLGGNSSEQED